MVEIKVVKVYVKYVLDVLSQREKTALHKYTSAKPYPEPSPKRCAAPFIPHMPLFHQPNSLRGVEDFSKCQLRWVWVLSEERAANPTEPVPKRAGCETIGCRLTP
jgi:hypothetical protein